MLSMSVERVYGGAHREVGESAVGQNWRLLDPASLRPDQSGGPTPDCPHPFAGHTAAKETEKVQ